MLQLVILGIAGLLGGAALGAARNRAPRPLLISLLVMAAIALVLAVASLPRT